MDTVLPIINIFLGLTAFIWGLLRATLRWGEYPSEIKLALASTGFLMLALLEAMLERITDSEPSNFNVVLITIGWSFMLFVLWRTRGALYRTGVRAPDNGDEINPNRAITSSHVPTPGRGEPTQGPQPVEMPGDRE